MQSLAPSPTPSYHLLHKPKQPVKHGQSWPPPTLSLLVVASNKPQSQLKLITEDSDSVTSFLQSIKAKADELALLGTPPNAEDLTDKILDGLASVITPKPDPFSFLPLLIPRAGTQHLGAHLHFQAPPIIHGTPPTATNTSILLHKPAANPHLKSQSTHPTVFLLLQTIPLPPLWQPRAHYASYTPSHTSWLLDNGASHHVTTNLHNLSMHTPYNGSDDIMIGDGSGLSITHTGFSSLHTTHNIFKLNNVLYVPTMKKNLISISQFGTSNNVSIEFLPTALLVKDIQTGITLLKGNTKDGVYEWPVSPPLLAFSSLKTTLSEWHQRLGHPAFKILKQIVSKNKLDFSSSLSNNFPYSIATWLPPPLHIPNLPLVPPLNPSSVVDA
ncbi:Retrovirus-related Pol polyprotein from transposon RE2 [Vitis vinifera]|uniref:Retrovirus-related Pol polyprotein from transposon RE2 n=1 Tax=Vitis vinifera TaxID=29760 RepID=A0A438EUZ2_VITVI|nr:Retrovirus-related Pol polyprotein from transposon RE2 [Vitis vinifera]